MFFQPKVFILPRDLAMSLCIMQAVGRLFMYVVNVLVCDSLMCLVCYLCMVFSCFYVCYVGYVVCAHVVCVCYACMLCM